VKSEDKVALYLNTRTGLWCRVTKRNHRDAAYSEDYKWKSFEKLYPRHQEKLSLLLLLEPAPRNAPRMTFLPGVGRVRRSRLDKELVYYLLLNESWRKDP
jgi:hypothetical protein